MPTHQPDGDSTPANGDSTPANGDGTPANGDGTPANGDGTPANGDGSSCASDSSSESDTSSLIGAVHPARKAQMMQAIVEEQNREILYLRQFAEAQIAQRKALLQAVVSFIDNQTFPTKPHGLGDLFMAFCDAAAAATPQV